MANDGALPEGEDLRRAVRWLSEQEGYTLEAVQEASRRFNLSPVDEQFLVENFLPGVEE